jgi:hypothetical protein
MRLPLRCGNEELLAAAKREAVVDPDRPVAQCSAQAQQCGHLKGADRAFTIGSGKGLSPYSSEENVDGGRETALIVGVEILQPQRPSLRAADAADPEMSRASCPSPPPSWRYDRPLKTAISKPLNLMPESASTSEITSSCYRMLLHGKREDPFIPPRPSFCEYLLPQGPSVRCVFMAGSATAFGSN